MTALSTLFRPPTQSPRQLCEALRAYDVDGVVLDGSLAADFVDELACTRLPAPIVAIESAGDDTREPMLASADPPERAAAAKKVRARLEQAARLDVGTLVVALGRLPNDPDWAETRLRYARREFSAEEAQAVLDKRRAQSVLAMDLARFALDAVVESAARASVLIGLQNRARWFEIPDETELAALLCDFAGAPLAPWLDAGAAHASESMGLAEPGSWLVRFGQQAIGAWMSDACGLLGRLPWGLGEIDTDAVASALGTDCVRVVHCAPASRPNEIRDALARAAKRDG